LTFTFCLRAVDRWRAFIRVDVTHRREKENAPLPSSAAKDARKAWRRGARRHRNGQRGRCMRAIVAELWRAFARARAGPSCGLQRERPKNVREADGSRTRRWTMRNLARAARETNSVVADHSKAASRTRLRGVDLATPR